MTSTQHPTDDPFRVYGMNHFTMKYGIRPEALSADIVKNEIQDRIVTWMDTPYGRVPLFEEPGGAGCMEKTGSRTRINFDVFNGVGHILSGHLEKLTPGEKAKIAGIPMVDIYERILFDALPGEIKTKPLWPDGKKFALCLTHDVDEIRKTYQYFSRPLLHIKRGEFKRAFEHIKSFFTDKLSGNNPYWTFEGVMRLEEELGVRSTFYFLEEDAEVKPLKPDTWKHYARRYKFNNLEIIKIIHKLTSGGWEVGLHGSFHSYNDREKLQRELDGLKSVSNEPVCGIRQHHLNMEIPKTWQYQGEIGLEYDTSLGHKSDIGFRWGTCFPFYPLDPDTGKPLSILEIPLTIMDTPLFTRRVDVWDECVDLVNAVEKQGGVLNLLWHHSVFNEREYPGWSGRYVKLIEMCKERGAWVATADEVNRWWRSR